MIMLSPPLRFIQGTEVNTPYVFYHWKYIDIFNYFSHHLVTIPPAMWTNAAHKHGVLSLGKISLVSSLVNPGSHSFFFSFFHKSARH